MQKRPKSIVSITTIAGTMDTFVLESMIQMQQNGWRVTLMCNATPELQAKVPQGMTLINVPMQRNFSIKTAIRCIRQMVKEFRHIKPAIVQYGTTHAALFGSIAAKIAKIPIRIHLQWGIYNYDEMGAKGWLFWLVEWIPCTLSTTIRPVSKRNLQVAIDDKFFKSGKGKVLGEGGTVGVDLTKYRLENKPLWRDEIRNRYSIPSDAYVYCFIGRMSTDKGTNELIEAFRKLETGHNVILLLVGTDEGYDKKLQKWAEQSRKVIFTGRVNHDEMQKVIASIDVLVHPTYREGFGMVIQEALAMAVPVITTDIPGPSEVIEQGVSGMLVQSKDVDGLAEMMLEFYNNQKHYQQFGLAGRKRVEQYFDRPVMLQNIYIDKEELYSNYINNK